MKDREQDRVPLYHMANQDRERLKDWATEWDQIGRQVVYDTIHDLWSWTPFDPSTIIDSLIEELGQEQYKCKLLTYISFIHDKFDRLPEELVPVTINSSMEEIEREAACAHCWYQDATGQAVFSCLDMWRPSLP